MSKNILYVIVVIVLILGFFLVVGGLLYVVDFGKKNLKDSNNTEEVQEQKEKSIDVSIELTNENGENPYFDIANSVVRLSNTVITDATKLNYNNENKYLLTLKELNDKYNVNIDQFNTDVITCEIEKTGVLFIKNDESITRVAQLYCYEPVG